MLRARPVAHDGIRTAGPATFFHGTAAVSYDRQEGRSAVTREILGVGWRGGRLWRRGMLQQLIVRGSDKRGEEGHKRAGVSLQLSPDRAQDGV